MLNVLRGGGNKWKEKVSHRPWQARGSQDKQWMMHRAKIARVPNGMGCDRRVPPGENAPEALGTSVLGFCCRGGLMVCGMDGKGLGNGKLERRNWCKLLVQNFGNSEIQISVRSKNPFFFGSRTKSSVCLMGRNIFQDLKTSQDFKLHPVSLERVNIRKEK